MVKSAVVSVIDWEGLAIAQALQGWQCHFASTSMGLWYALVVKRRSLWSVGILGFTVAAALITTGVSVYRLQPLPVPPIDGSIQDEVAVSHSRPSESKASTTPLRPKRPQPQVDEEKQLQNPEEDEDEGAEDRQEIEVDKGQEEPWRGGVEVDEGPEVPAESAAEPPSPYEST
eukprot:3922134-Amphidinium_carterae.1